MQWAPRHVRPLICQLARSQSEGSRYSDPSVILLTWASAGTTAQGKLSLRFMHWKSNNNIYQSLLPYMNPVLTQSIRSAFYFSHKSIVKRVHLLLKRYPALEHAEYCRNWSDGIPRGAWVLCCVAVSKQYCKIITEVCSLQFSFVKQLNSMRPERGSRVDGLDLPGIGSKTLTTHYVRVYLLVIMKPLWHTIAKRKHISIWPSWYFSERHIMQLV